MTLRQLQQRRPSTYLLSRRSKLSLKRKQGNKTNRSTLILVHKAWAREKSEACEFWAMALQVRGCTALISAAGQGNLNVVKKLLDERGAAIDAKEADGSISQELPLLKFIRAKPLCHTSGMTLVIRNGNLLPLGVRNLII